MNKPKIRKVAADLSKGPDGPTASTRAQAVSIALREAGMSRKLKLKK